MVESCNSSARHIEHASGSMTRPPHKRHAREPVRKVGREINGGRVDLPRGKRVNHRAAAITVAPSMMHRTR